MNVFPARARGPRFNAGPRVRAEPDGALKAALSSDAPLEPSPHEFAVRQPPMLMETEAIARAARRCFAAPPKQLRSWATHLLLPRGQNDGPFGLLASQKQIKEPAATFLPRAI